MFEKKFLPTIAVLGLVLIVASLQMSSVGVRGQTVTYPADSIWFDPAAVSYSQYNGSVGTMFNVTAWTNMSVASTVWQIDILYDPSIINCTKSGLTAVSTSQFFAGHATIPGGPNLGIGEVKIGESLLGADTVNASSGSLAWFTFQIVRVANATNTHLTDALSIASADDNYVLDVNGATIPSSNFGATFSSSYTIDTTPPTIANPTQVPANGSVLDGESVTVSTNVTDISGVANVTLSYSTNDVTFTNVTMTLNATTGLWVGTIPGYATGTTVYYYITAYDNVGNPAVNANTGNWRYIVPEYTSVLIILMLIAMTSAVLLMRKKMPH